MLNVAMLTKSSTKATYMLIYSLDLFVNSADVFVHCY